MQINLTFFIQIINFFIAYWFLRKFMFNPVIAFLQSRDEKENNTQKRLQEKEQKLLNLENKKQEALIQFQLYAKKEYAVLPEKSIEIPSQVACSVDSEEIEKLTKVSKDILVKKVPHVD